MHDDLETLVDFFKAQATESRAVFAAVQGQLSDLDVTLEIHWVKSLESDPTAQTRTTRAVVAAAKALGGFWCDLKTNADVRFYLVGAGDGPALARSVARTPTSGHTETLAVTVREWVKVLVEDAREPEPPPKVEPDPVRPPSRRWLELELGYAFEA